MIDLELHPHVGVLPLRFGMSREEVRIVLGMGPHPRYSRPGRDEFAILGVNYDGDGRAAEYCLHPDKVRLTFAGVELLARGPSRTW